ncbi:MAG: DUF4956 domain-containing protein [Kiritimatiellaceae bacterium]|nr:DUF4956 domain-containing protein [Kiritimatiellaceae bacterium]
MNTGGLTDLMSAAGSAQTLSLQHVISAMLLSFVLCSVIAKLYQLTFQSLSYSRAFVHTLILGGMITCMVMMAMGDSLARGVGVLGALSLIRFRTVIRDPRDMMFLFASLGLGVSCGAGLFAVSIVGCLILSSVILLLHFAPFATRRRHEAMLRFLVETNDDTARAEVDKVLAECCSAFMLLAMREAVQGDLLEYSYQVRLIDPSYQVDIVKKLEAIGSVAEVNLIMQRTTVEL